LPDADPLPAVLRLTGPDSAASSLATVALTDELRRRGYRVGTASRRPAAFGASEATVLVLGSGARVTLEGTLGSETLAARAAALDPQLELLLTRGYEDAGDEAPALGLSDAEPGTQAARRLADRAQAVLPAPAGASDPEDVPFGTERSRLPDPGLDYVADKPEPRGMISRLRRVSRVLKGRR
jgi:hypothetical protein